MAPAETLSRPPQTMARATGDVDVPDPVPGQTWRASDGTSYPLERTVIGKGKTATAYGIADGEFAGDVLKTFKDPAPPSNPYAPHFTASDTVDDVLHGADVLEKHGILTLKTKRGVTGSGRPHVIQERLRPGDVVFDERAALSPDHQRAVAELYESLAKKGIVWEDGHINNIFFRKVGNEWKAGILDTDRIFEWGHVPSRRLAFIMESVRTVGFPGVTKKVGKMQSFTGNPHYWTPNSAEEFMAKMLEYNGWIEFDAGAFKAKRLDPSLVRDRFELKDSSKRADLWPDLSTLPMAA